MKWQEGGSPVGFLSFIKKNIWEFHSYPIDTKVSSSPFSLCCYSSLHISPVFYTSVDTLVFHYIWKVCLCLQEYLYIDRLYTGLQNMASSFVRETAMVVEGDFGKFSYNS